MFTIEEKINLLACVQWFIAGGIKETVFTCFELDETYTLTDLKQIFLN
jgi:hypothetical protein